MVTTKNRKFPTSLVATRNMRIKTKEGSVSLKRGEAFEASSEAEARYLYNINKAVTPEEWAAEQSGAAPPEDDGYESWSKAELIERAKELDIAPGTQTKAQLIEAIEAAEGDEG